MRDPRIVLDTDFIPLADRAALRLRLFTSLWRQDSVTVYGRTHLVPRLQQWYGDPGRAYTWSGVRMEPLPWPAWLLDLRWRVSQRAGVAFNSALANLYRDGRDTVGWHADDEPELGADSVIASVSLGAARDFKLREIRTREVSTLSLTDGSLLIMGAGVQRDYQHSLPRRARVAGPRYNLTFRRVL